MPFFTASAGFGRDTIVLVNNLRKYGNPPFFVALVHGGPGASGEMAPVARELAKERGVLEPLQSEATLAGQVEELSSVLKRHATTPAILVGYSYGAILSFLVAAKNPGLVKKLILVASAVFEDEYARGIMTERRRRLPAEDNARLDSLLATLDDPASTESKNVVFGRIGALLQKADAYDPLPNQDEILECRHDIHDSVWPEVSAMRASGELLEYGKNIRCPVVAIHGDFDPHPAEGVRQPLSGVLRDFKFILLEKCGHTPWIERWASDGFYRVLKLEIARAP